MKQLQQAAYKDARSEFGQISQQVSLDLGPWIEQVSEWATGDPIDALMNLAATPWLVPSWALAEETADQLLTTAPLSQLIPMISLDDGRPVSNPRGDAEQREDNIRRQYHIQLPFRWAFLDRGLETLCTSMNLTSDDFINTLRRSPAFAALSIERVGFDRYLEKDYVGSVHILAPRIETALRELLARTGGTTTAVRNRVMTEKSIDQLLEEEVLQVLLSRFPGLTRYIAEVLVEPTGPNIRNKVAHGLISSEACDSSAANALVHILLILSLFRSPPGMTTGQAT